MALLAEELVEEWLNRQGYFTIRGIKIGVDEIDLLAVKFDKGKMVCRHVEVQASMRPIGYISKMPKEAQKQGKKVNSASRNDQELVDGVKEWVFKKFKKDKKRELLKSLGMKDWTSELVLNNVKSQDEVELIKKEGIVIHQLKDILLDLNSQIYPVQSASGADFFDLVNLGFNAK